MGNTPKTALALAEYEGRIDACVADYGRETYRKNVQPIADALPRIGSDGKPLLESRKVAQQVLTRYGVVELSLFSGRCQTTGKFEMPFKTLYCRGERHPVSPLLEQGREASGRLTRR